jgi:hypothetical protein
VERWIQTNDELTKAVTVRKKSQTGEKVEWLKIQWIQVRKSEPLKMYYKYSVQDDVDFSCVNFAKKGRTDKLGCSLGQLHPQQPRALSSDKVKDIRKLLKYVPPIYHDFYTRFESSTTCNELQLCEDELLGQSDIESETNVLAAPTVDQTAVDICPPKMRKRRSGEKPRKEL